MGKLKIAVTLLVIAALGAGLYMQQQTIAGLRQQIEALKQENAKIASLQEELEQSRQETANVGGNAESQKHELVRLRAEVSKLRDQTGQLSKAQQEIGRLNDRLTAEEEAKQAAAAQQQANNQAARLDAQKSRAMNACINNLRLIDSAKQQWALENRKGAGDTPTWDDLRPYIGRGANGELPTCPEGGVYTIGTVSEKPTCSIPGHVLP